MASKNKPYEQFGPYLLFKKLESDALGQLFRAARIENRNLGHLLALRRLSGGNREALTAAAEAAETFVSSLNGPSFAKDQRIEVIGGTAIVTHDYASGRSLRYIVDRARGNGSPASPIPLDQAIIIVERAALSVAATGELRVGGERLLHGALIPQFVWITDEGEIRVAGQGLAHGIIASLRDEKVASEIGRYFAPETQHAGHTSASTEVYALGAILYLAVTGHEPPDATRASAFTHALRAAKTMAGEPVPDEIRGILEKSLNIDPAARYASPADMRAALAALTASGRYSATSFNLAFYLSSLLKKEMEGESVERERESKVDPAPYADAAAMPVVSPAMIEEPAAEKKSRAPMAVAAVIALAAAGAGAWYVLASRKTTAPAPALATASVVSPPTVQQRPSVVPEPIIATAAPETDTAGTAAVQAPATAIDEAERTKAFEAAVRKRLQEELLKLQAEYTRELQQQQARNAPALTTAAPQTQTTAPPLPPEAEARIASLQPESSRRELQRSETEPAPVVPTVTAPPPAETQTVAPPPVTAAPSVGEGDVVDMNDLDKAPVPTREVRPVYPPIAARQKIEATVMASILISETGEVIDVKILRGDARFGFNDAAIRALRSARYTPPMKDGKRVKTWVAQLIQFKP